MLELSSSQLDLSGDQSSSLVIDFLSFVSSEKAPGSSFFSKSFSSSLSSGSSLIKICSDLSVVLRMSLILR